MMSQKTIKWGILGCGNIAGKFATDLKLVPDAELSAVASSDITKAKEFSNTHHSKRYYDSYDALFNDSEIDIIYIATIHVSHAELSIRAMKHGKHVLCEKPLALNAKEAVKMIEISKQTQCFFMEALWTRFNPVFIEVLKRIKNKEIGEVNYINADFAFRSNHTLDSRVFNLDLGGGTILDIGIYPVFLTYTVLGIPKNIISSAILHETTGCDIQTSMIFEYPKASANLYSSFTSDSDMIAKISGTEGHIHINNRWHESESFTIVKNGTKKTIQLSKIGKGYAHEIMECHHCIRENKIESDLWSHQNSLDLISILDDVREQIGLVYPQEKSNLRI